MTRRRLRLAAVSLLVVGCSGVGGGIQVVGLDPKTGKTVWRDNASPGDITPGVAPGLGVAGSTVAFLSPVDNSTRSSQLVGVDAATGRRLWHTPTGQFADWPAPCPDAPSDICTSGSFGDVAQTLALRFRASDGAQVGAVLIAQSAYGRMLGPDLYDPGVRDPEAIVAVSGNSVAWTRPLASVFSSPGDSTDWGWSFDRVPAAGVFVGFVAGPPVSSTATSDTTSVARGMTAGFRISDGSVAWQDAGTMYACSVLPCPGQGMNSAGPPTMGLRLRVTGTATDSLSDLTPKLSAGGDVVIEGFNLATGKHKLISPGTPAWCGSGTTSFVGITVDGLTVTSDSSEVAAVPTGSS